MKTLFTLVSSLVLLTTVAFAQVVGTRDVVPAGCFEPDNPKEVAELLSKGKMQEAAASARKAVEAQECGPIGLPGELTQVVATFGDFSVVEFTITVADEKGRPAKLPVYTIVKVKTSDI
jgi:hypothetical protein